MKQQENISKERNEFATLLNPVEIPDESTIFRAGKDKDKSTYYFEEQRFKLDPLYNLTALPSQNNHFFHDPQTHNFLKFIFSNCKIFLQVENFIIEGLSEDQYFELVLAVGDNVISANSFLINSDRGTFLYGTNFWTEIKYEQLSDASIAITSVDGPIAAETLNLKSHLDSLSLKMPFFSNLKIAKGQNPKLRINVFGDLVLIPCNLEIAHTIIDAPLIELNFDRFAQLIKSCDTPAAYLSQYFPAAYSRAANSYARIAKGLRPYLESAKILIHSFGSTSVAGLLSKCPPTGSWSLIFADISKFAQSGNQEILDSHKLYNVYSYVQYLAKGISPVERFWIAENLMKIKNKEFINLKFLEDAFWSPTTVTEIAETIDSFERRFPSVCAYRAIVKEICNSLQVMLENNIFGGKLSPIHFSPKFVGVVCHYVDLCARDLSDRQILTVCANALLTNICLNGYSRLGFLNQLDYLYAFFSALLRHSQPELFISLVRFGQEWNNVVSQCVLGNFSTLVDSSAFGAANDLIQGLVLFLYTRTNNIIEVLNDSRLEIGAVLILFIVVEAFAHKREHLMTARRSEFELLVKNGIAEVLVNLESHLGSILGLFLVCQDQNWFSRDLELVRHYLTPANNERRSAFFEMQACLNQTKAT